MLKSKLAAIIKTKHVRSLEVLRVTDEGTLNFCAHPEVRAS